MNRPMNDAEKTRFKKYFPRLDLNRARVTGDATPKYNCISWTVGVTDRWIWPGANISDFDLLYKRFG
jgi:hypothetical protein